MQKLYLNHRLTPSLTLLLFIYLVYCQAAALGGVTPAIYNMANCYASGCGVEQNDANAYSCYRICADSGYVKAKFTGTKTLDNDPHGIYNRIQPKVLSSSLLNAVRSSSSCIIYHSFT
jgi:TPR repeat protein